MIGNGSELPLIQSSSSQKTQKWFPNLGLPLVIVNAFLLVPYCGIKGCPFEFAAFNILAGGYLLILGFPTTLVLYLCPDVIRENSMAFIPAYVVNFVIISYFLGQFVSWTLRRLVGRRWEKNGACSIGR